MVYIVYLFNRDHKIQTQGRGAGHRRRGQLHQTMAPLTSNIGSRCRKGRPPVPWRGKRPFLPLTHQKYRKAIKWILSIWTINTFCLCLINSKRPAVSRVKRGCPMATSPDLFHPTAEISLFSSELMLRCMSSTLRLNSSLRLCRFSVPPHFRERFFHIS